MEIVISILYTLTINKKFDLFENNLGECLLLVSDKIV